MNCFEPRHLPDLSILRVASLGADSTGEKLVQITNPGPRCWLRVGVLWVPDVEGDAPEGSDGDFDLWAGFASRVCANGTEFSGDPVAAGNIIGTRSSPLGLAHASGELAKSFDTSSGSPAILLAMTFTAGAYDTSVNGDWVLQVSAWPIPGVGADEGKVLRERLDATNFGGPLKCSSESE